MIQQVMTAPREIGFVDIPIPQPGVGQVLLKMKRIGVCGSDIHVYHGKHPYTSYPVTQGHEVSARIVSLGDGVRDLKPGQKVTVEPQVYCGKCYPCTHGRYNLCENLKVMGFQSTGMAGEYFAVDASKVTPLPDNISYDEGAMIEPLAVTIHAARRAGDVSGKNFAVIGAGPIGILLIQSLKALGAGKVLATDISDYRLGIAAKCGADRTVNTQDRDFGEVLLETFGPDRADVIYDCAGNNISLNQAIQNARKGSRLVLVAVFANLATADMAKLNDSELTLDTSMMYRHEDYVDAIRLVSEGKIRLKPLMSKHFPLREYGKAYEFIDENREFVMKVLIDIDEDED